jgi:hypothetical protein
VRLALGTLDLIGWGSILLLGLTLFAGQLAYPHFWTSDAVAGSPPWYFIGRTFVSAVVAAPALLLTIATGIVAQRKLGREVWGRLALAILFLSYAVAQGVNVLAHTSRIWSETGASTRWKTFDELLASDTLVGFAALAVTGAVVFYVSWPSRRRAT